MAEVDEKRQWLPFDQLLDDTSLAHSLSVERRDFYHSM
jgi:hypothetical protein